MIDHIEEFFLLFDFYGIDAAHPQRNFAYTRCGRSRVNGAYTATFQLRAEKTMLLVGEKKVLPEVAAILKHPGKKGLVMGHEIIQFAE